VYIFCFLVSFSLDSLTISLRPFSFAPPPLVRPFSGFYKAREGRVFMPLEMRHVPWGIVVHDLLVVFPVDSAFSVRNKRDDEQCF
jgi:hypothetical protein